jgi:hypothetical protein
MTTKPFGAASPKLVCEKLGWEDLGEGALVGLDEGEARRSLNGLRKAGVTE